MLDVTIVYPDGTPSFWDLISGQIPRVRVDVREVPLDPAWRGRDYADDEAFREEFQAFIRQVWTEKDDRIARMRRRASSPRAARAVTQSFDSRTMTKCSEAGRRRSARFETSPSCG